MSQTTSEFWKTVRAYRKWIGWVIVGAFFVLSLQQGWVTMSDAERVANQAVRIIQALVPGGE